ncbi:MAG: DUF3253 domain-containing protein [Inquilinus sp.]|nr:DUF3253 domain-containing protein [Inquilinus sp.]
MNTDPTTDTLDPLAETILRLLAERGAAKSITPEDAARAYAESRAKRGDPPDLWRRYLHAARQQALHLARAGRIAILRKGKPVDPTAPVKGVIRLAVPGNRPPAELPPNG